MDFPDSIRIHTTNNVIPTTITRIEADQVEGILGVRLGFDGKYNNELDYRTQDDIFLAGRIKKGSLSQQDTEIVYCERWVSSIKYYLPITRFTTV